MRWLFTWYIIIIFVPSSTFWLTLLVSSMYVSSFSAFHEHMQACVLTHAFGTLSQSNIFIFCGEFGFLTIYLHMANGYPAGMIFRKWSISSSTCQSNSLDHWTICATCTSSRAKDTNGCSYIKGHIALPGTHESYFTFVTIDEGLGPTRSGTGVLHGMLLLGPEDDKGLSISCYQLQ